MTDHKMQLVDWLDDLCVRFIVNLPHEELQSVERICFQIEEAQWFYEDFIRPLDPNMPSMNLRRFSLLMFKHCPLTCDYPEELHVKAYEDFLAYKTRVPVRGAIMLNAEMTQAVLVKGWKKGAKWSFPRGKINKEEADLDCAVREVYEETGYDLRGAGLVGPDEQMKRIGVSMREQDMMLYVFRGVPMDTHFEPRTRKEISKIGWYKLTDLPTLRRKHHIQQGTGQDLVKENNFYMVAPFLGPLKAWIKQQNRLDKQKAKAGAQLAVPVASGVTDTEDLEVDVGEITADEVPIPDMQPSDGNFADLVANLGRGHRSSDALPEVSSQQIPQVLDPATELKRLLSVGSGLPLQTPTVEAPAPGQEPQANPLLAMLHGNNKSPAPLPHTPLEQYMPPPAQPHSPHGQHHPRPPHLDRMPPPPLFPFQPHHNMPFRGPYPPHVPPQPLNGIPIPIPRHFMPLHHRNLLLPTHPPNVQEAFTQQAPRPYQRTGDPQFAQPSQFAGVHAPAIPPASKLPPPKLTAHALGLLNAFKSQEKPAPPPPELHSQRPQSSQATPRMQQPPALHRGYESFTSPQGLPSANPYAPSPPPFQSPPNVDLQPAQPKPRSAHQNALLDLFRSQSVAAVTPPPPKGSEPVELSAHPTPGHRELPSTAHEADPPKPDLKIKPNFLEAFGQPLKQPELTSATISGPVNVPDFETVRKSTHLNDANGHSREPSPAQRKSVEPKAFAPKQILKREDTATSRISPTNVGHPDKAESPQTTSNVTTPQAPVFKPQILKRPQQNGSLPPAPGPSSSPHQVLGKQTSPTTAPSGPSHFPAMPAAPHAFDRREMLPADQKNVLLSLFGKSSQPVGFPVQVSKSPVPPQGLPYLPAGLPTLPPKSPLPKSPVPPARSPQPPTPKSLVSGVISPVSPLPDKGSQQNSPANLASRSRISSIGDTMLPNIVIPKELIPTSNPATTIQRNEDGNAEEGYASAGSVGLNDSLNVLNKGKGKSATSPVDKSFLLGFLEDVARRGGRGIS